MTKIAIIGNAGGGKSTVARTLRDLLGLPLHSIDQLQWRPGWQPAPREEFVAAHAKLMAGPRWIIDGWGDIDAIEQRFHCADTIVLVDYPLYRHYWWAIKRQIKCVFSPRTDGPAGCPMLPMTFPLLKMIWTIDRSLMPGLRTRVNKHRDEKKVFHIRSLGELREFYRTANDFSRTKR